MATLVELTKAQEERAEALHNEALIIDALGGHIVAPEPPPFNGKPYLDRLIESNVRTVNITIAAHADNFEEALRMMFAYYNLIDARPDKTLHVLKASDIERAYKEGKVGVVFGFQTGSPIDKEIHKWTILHKLGLRICQLTYMERSVFGDGCYEPENRGLTAYGRQAVNEMNRLGIVLDCSHGGERTTLDAIEYSKKPCIYSHSNVKALCPSDRNITDEHIRACAAKGGVIGLSPHSALTYKEYGVRPNVNDYLDHLDYVANLVGTDHIGIGSDVFESYTKIAWESSTKRMYPSPWFLETKLSEGFSKITEIRNVTRGLVARGYSDQDIKHILGLNWLRVFKAVWQE